MFLKNVAVSTIIPDVGDEYAREKASQVLRDAVALLPEAERIDDDKSANGTTASDADEMPELSSESHNRRQVAAKKRNKRKVEQMSSPAYFPAASFRHHDAVPEPSWQYSQAAATLSPVRTIKPVLTPPPMKRMFSGSIFENSAFFTGNNIPTRSPNPPPLSPFFQRQESLCLSLGAVSFPGDNFLLHNKCSDHGRIPTDVIINAPLSDSNASDEFVSDFY